MHRIGAGYIFTIILAITTVIAIFFTTIAVTGLRFQRTRAITVQDFSLETNDYVSAKFFFIVIIPMLTLWIVPITLFGRLYFISTLDIFGLHEGFNFINSNNKKPDAEKGKLNDNISKYLNEDRKIELGDAEKAYRTIHLVVSAIALIFVAIAFILLCVDFSSANDPIGGSTSLATSLLYCCAVDVRPAPGITPGCPWIQSCAGISPPVTTGSLSYDNYFIFAFVMYIVLFVILIVHLWIGMWVMFDKEQEYYDEMSLQKINDNDLLKSAPIVSKMPLPRLTTTTNYINQKDS